MESVSAHLDRLVSANQKALAVFVTAGDQPLEELPDLLSALCEGGADIVEIGLPFSDPFGEGPTIQASSERSLARGTKVRSILQALREIQLNVPVVTMGYVNPVLRFGFRDYAAALATAKVSASIIQDLVPEEADEWCAAAAENGLDTIFLVAPTSTDHRVKAVCSRTTGFVYAVSRTGVTGAGSGAPLEVADLVHKVRKLTRRPVLVGFGISTREHVRRVCEVADGAIVGSALVDLLHREWRGGKGRSQVVDYLRELKA